MIRPVRLVLPDADFASPAPTRPVRLLAVSDEVDRALLMESNHERIKPIDLVVGSGDLEPSYLAMLGDAFRVPLLYVTGNHDRGLGWQADLKQLPEQLPNGDQVALGGLRLMGFNWPGPTSGRAERDEWAAWWQVLRPGLRHGRGNGPRVIVSHVPPLGAGDDPADPYHRGFRAYRWLVERLKPTLWLHGHTTVTSHEGRVLRHGPTTLVNVTGGAVVELVPESVAAFHGDTGGRPADPFEPHEPVEPLEPLEPVEPLEPDVPKVPAT